MASMGNFTIWGSMSSKPLLWVERSSFAIDRPTVSVGVVNSIPMKEMDPCFKKALNEI